MKRVTAILLSLCMVLALAGCSGNTDATQAPTTEAAQAETGRRSGNNYRRNLYGVGRRE